MFHMSVMDDGDGRSSKEEEIVLVIFSVCLIWFFIYRFLEMDWSGLNLFIVVLSIVMMMIVVIGGMIVCLKRFFRGVVVLVSGLGIGGVMMRAVRRRGMVFLFFFCLFSFGDIEAA